MSDRTGARDRGWLDAGDAGDDRWPICYRGTSGRIHWTLLARPGPETSEGDAPPDTIWWSCDIALPEFQLVAGFTRVGPLDWLAQPGVERPTDLDDALDGLMNRLETASDLNAFDERAVAERPWLSIGRFLQTADDLPVTRPGLEHLQVKANDAAVAQQVIDDRVASALVACIGLVTDTESSLRIWVGPPNLRVELIACVANEAARAAALQQVVELGAAIAATLV